MAAFGGSFHFLDKQVKVWESLALGPWQMVIGDRGVGALPPDPVAGLLVVLGQVHSHTVIWVAFMSSWAPGIQLQLASLHGNPGSLCPACSPALVQGMDGQLLLFQIQPPCIMHLPHVMCHFRHPERRELVLWLAATQLAIAQLHHVPPPPSLKSCCPHFHAAPQTCQACVSLGLCTYCAFFLDLFCLPSSG
jgi:hypothetical protein